MTQPSDSYSPMIFWVTPVKGRVVDQPQLTLILVRGVRVDILVKIVKRVLFGLKYVRPDTTDEFDYRIKIG